METLEEILHIYDNSDKKNFDLYEISNLLSKLPEKEKARQEVKSELLAFSFQDNTGKRWGTYLGPLTTWVKKDTGEEICRPDYKEITDYDIERWEKRVEQTKNPFLLMRYSGLVYDFKKKIMGVNPDFHKIIKPYANSILKVVEGEYPNHIAETYMYAERLFDVAYSKGLDDLFEKAKEVLWNLDSKYGVDEKPGLWGCHFQIMIKYLQKYSDYEEKIVQVNEDRFNRLELNIKDEHTRNDRFIHILFDECELLCDYYKRKGNSEAIKSHIDRLLPVTRFFIKTNGALWSQEMLQRIQHIYRKFHFYKEANKLYVDIQDMGSTVFKEMQEREYTIPIEKKQLDAYIKDLTEVPAVVALVCYLYRNTPNINIERQRQKEEAIEVPLLDMIRTTIFDTNGNPISNIGVGDKAEEQKLMNGMYRRMLITANLLRLDVKAMEEKGYLNKDIVLEAFKDSPIIADGQKDIFRKGIEAYFEKDYLVACHLLVPQFECAVRRLVALNGGEILRSNKDSKNGNEYISLDGLLDSDTLKELLGEDIQLYYKNLFTDKYGWNIRNTISHGLLRTEGFNSTIADRIVHAFMLLSLVKEVKEE